MPSAAPPLFPSERRRLDALGARLRLARKRRRLGTETVAARAGISRTTLYKAEAGEAAVTLGTYLRILVALGLDSDLDRIAADDALGRKLQDLALDPPHPRSPAR